MRWQPVATRISVASAVVIASFGCGTNLQARLKTPCQTDAECSGTLQEAQAAYDKCTPGPGSLCESERSNLMMAEIRNWRLQRKNLQAACSKGDDDACVRLNSIADRNLNRYFGMADYLRWETVDRSREWQVSKEEFQSSAVEACMLACSRSHHQHCCEYVEEVGDERAAARAKQARLEGCSRACAQKCDECGNQPAACEEKLQACLASCGEHLLLHCRE